MQNLAAIVAIKFLDRQLIYMYMSSISLVDIGFKSRNFYVFKRILNISY